MIFTVVSLESTPVITYVTSAFNEMSDIYDVQISSVAIKTSFHVWAWKVLIFPSRNETSEGKVLRICIKIESNFNCFRQVFRMFSELCWRWIIVDWRKTNCRVAFITSIDTATTATELQSQEKTSEERKKETYVGWLPHTNTQRVLCGLISLQQWMNRWRVGWCLPWTLDYFLPYNSLSTQF